MTRIVNEAPRSYRSDLRAEQAEETRGRILDATVRVMAGGPASVSIPAVAREAGVSIPTVYRHFRTKPDLLAAVYPHLARRAGFNKVVMPSSVDEFRAMVLTIFGGLDSLGDPARAAMASPAAEEARRATMPSRLAMSRRFAETIAPTASGADRDRIARLLIVLTTSAAMRMWRDHLGSSVEEAADDIEWLVRSVIAAAAGSSARDR
jgi:AcrR family transcriptional regulator